MKYYYWTEVDSRHIVDVVRDEENEVYHVVFADHSSMDYKIDDEITSILERNLQRQLNEVLSMRFHHRCCKKISSACFDVFTTLMIFSCVCDMTDIWPMGIVPSAFLGYLVSKDKDFLELTDDARILAYRGRYKEEVVEYLSSDSEAGNCFDNPDTYQKLCTMIDEGRNPFSLICANEVDVSEEEFDRLMEGIYQMKKVKRKEK